jgi:hypothetical protein
MMLQYRFLFVCFVLLTSVASAFIIAPQHCTWGRTTTAKTNNNKLSMTVTDESTTNAGSPLEVVSTTTTAADMEDTLASSSSSTTSPKKMIARNLGRGGEIQEFNFVDPYMAANTRPWEMNWWAYILFGFPFVLLLNDALHFLPTEGPLSFLTTL